jgi:hypothetical protein
MSPWASGPTTPGGAWPIDVSRTRSSLSTSGRTTLQSRGPEAAAVRRATSLARHVGDLSEPFLRRLSVVADLLICHVDGWWEFFTERLEWHQRLRSHWPQCRERPLSLAGRPFGALAG